MARYRRFPVRLLRAMWAASGRPGRLRWSIALIVVLCGNAAAIAESGDIRHFTVGSTAVSVQLPEPSMSIGTEALIAWIARDIHIVSAYYGRFPTETLRIRIVARPGTGVRTGTTWGDGGGLVRLVVGRDLSESEMSNDWVLVHEFTHLALPDVGEEHAWLSEGLAVYVEGVERARAGNRTLEDVAAEWLRSMPKGLPRAGDHGLDHTHTWARTYWGGALFCLMADVAIHRQTHNRLGLQDAMRAVLARSGGLSTEWPIERVLRTGDAATGTRVLEQLYADMKDKPVTPDLPRLWRQLGLEINGPMVKLRDDAPLADVRKAILRGPLART